MYTLAHKHHVSFSELFRWAARFSAISLFACWLTLVILELLRAGPPTTVNILGQAAALAVVFAGYAIGFRKELLGGLLAIIGTIAFFVVNAVITRWLPPPEAVWLAVPGVLYVLAWWFENWHRGPMAGRS